MLLCIKALTLAQWWLGYRKSLPGATSNVKNCMLLKQLFIKSYYLKGLDQRIKMLKIVVTALIAYLLVLPVCADEIADYTRIYHKQCATCHGNNGDGRGRAGASLMPVPTNFTSEESRQRLNRDRIVHAIRHGVAGTSMSAYGKRYDESTLKGLASYVYEQFIAKKEGVIKSAGDEDGRAIYVQHCSACHGDNGNTAVWAKNALNPAPRNFTASEAKAELSLERMITSVTYGRPGTAMMSFEKRLTSEQIQSVVGFIRQTFMQINEDKVEDKPAKAEIAIDSVNMMLPFPNGLKGNLAAGKQFFDNNCFTCHGKKGDGKGPRAYFNIPRPRNFTSAESRRILNRPRLFKGISHGKPRTVMPAWSTVLSDQQIADVAEYVFQTFVQVKKKH